MLVVAWKWELIGGIIIAGALFIISHFLRRKEAKKQNLSIN